MGFRSHRVRSRSRGRRRGNEDFAGGKRCCHTCHHEDADERRWMDSVSKTVRILRSPGPSRSLLNSLKKERVRARSRSRSRHATRRTEPSRKRRRSSASPGRNRHKAKKTRRSEDKQIDLRHLIEESYNSSKSGGRGSRQSKTPVIRRAPRRSIKDEDIRRGSSSICSADVQKTRTKDMTSSSKSTEHKVLEESQNTKRSLKDERTEERKKVVSTERSSIPLDLKHLSPPTRRSPSLSSISSCSTCSSSSSSSCSSSQSSPSKPPPSSKDIKDEEQTKTPKTSSLTGLTLKVEPGKEAVEAIGTSSAGSVKPQGTDHKPQMPGTSKRPFTAKADALAGLVCEEMKLSGKVDAMRKALNKEIESMVDFKAMLQLVSDKTDEFLGKVDVYNPNQKKELRQDLVKFLQSSGTMTTKAVQKITDQAIPKDVLKSPVFFIVQQQLRMKSKDLFNTKVLFQK